MGRVAVFIDYQNVYRGARDVFHWEHNHFTYGQISPRRLALWLVKKGHTVDPTRTLEYVKAYRGEPSAKHSPGGQAACQRQVEYWNAQKKVEGVTRPLKYYRDGTDANGNTTFTAREKGIDVLVALGMVVGALNDEYDTAILCSKDSDLAPAVETVLDLGKRVEVMAWRKPGEFARRIALDRKVWTHWFDERDYNITCDDIDYTKVQPAGTLGEPQEPRSL